MLTVHFLHQHEKSANTTFHHSPVDEGHKVFRDIAESARVGRTEVLSELEIAGSGAIVLLASECFGP